MKNSITLFLFLIALNFYAQQTFIPDDNFEQFLIDAGKDNVLDDFVLTSNIDNITSLGFNSNSNITDLTGIEDFTSLVFFRCDGNPVTNLHLTQSLPLLQVLKCNNSSLTSLNVNNYSSLYRLECNDNNLTNLIFDQNPTLKIIECNNNQLTTLNFGQNMVIEDIDCSNNPLNSLDTSQNLNLKKINFAYTNLSGNDFNLNTTIENLRCNNNPLGFIDVSQFGNLTSLNVLNTQLTSLDVSQNPLLITLNCVSNNIANLNVSQNLALIQVQCQNNEITSLELSQSSNLNFLTCQNNNLITLNVRNSNNINFLEFNATSNLNLFCIEVDSVAYSTINWLNIDPTTSFNQDCSSVVISKTYVPDNNFEQALIDLGYDTVLDDFVYTFIIETITTLQIPSYAITDLTGIEDFTSLSTLLCNNNQLVNLNLSQNTNLVWLNCSDNVLQNLDVSSNSLLFHIECNFNQLTSLDLSQNTSFTSLRCNDNLLSDLNLQNGNNSNMPNSEFFINNNPNLNCILVDNPTYSNNTWSNNNVNAGFSTDCTNKTYVPDDNFEQFLITFGLDFGVLDDYVYTSNINTNLALFIDNNNIVNLTGIEDFTALKFLFCGNNQISSLDLSQNNALTILDCKNNFLTNLNVKNSNNINLMTFNATNNPNLSCIEVDNAVYSTTNWTNIDATTSFSEDCNYDTIWENNHWTYPPQITRNAIIKQDYSTLLQNSFEANTFTIDVGFSLTINPNTYVKVTNDFTNNGTIIIENTGSFVQVDNIATITGSGSYVTKINTTTLDDQSRFTYFSSPVQNESLNVFNAWANMNQLWSFDAIIQNWTPEIASTIMQAINGIAVTPNASNTFPFIAETQFNGAFNNGVFSRALIFNAGGIDDDNIFTGNPYPSAIDASLLLSNNTNANAFYFWTHNSNYIGSTYVADDYAIWNNSGGLASDSGSPAPTGFIASGQGFFVDAVGAGNFVFDNAYRVTNNNTDFRISETEADRDRIWLNLTTDDGLFSQMLLNFSPNASTDFDAKLDATRYLTENPISFHSIGRQREHFAIQALPIFSEDKTIPLGIVVTNENINLLKISLDHLDFQNLNPENINIYLKDNWLNNLHDLKASDYEFSTNATTDLNNRFELIFNRNSLAISDLNELNTALIISNYSENQIQIKTTTEEHIMALEIFDVLGKTLLKSTANQSKIIINTNTKTGTILFVKTTLANGKVFIKKFLKL